jgi:hypothetical protein
MMACNDLTLTDQALADWKKEQRRNRISKQLGACMYFIRAQIAHFYEGLDIIPLLKKDKDLSSIIASCNSHTQECLRELEQYVRGGPKRDRLEQLAGKIRHNLVFHYKHSGKLIKKVISHKANSARQQARVSVVTQGDTMHLWHFKLADDVVHDIVVHEIWQIPRGDDVSAKADAIAEDELHNLILMFLDFSGEFIWKYL